MFGKKKDNKGFTLVELLVVVAIIGILAIVAVPALFKNIEKGKVADLEADINAIRSASLSYYADKSEYPSNIDTQLKDEIEGLSKPFGGIYTIEKATTTSNGIKEGDLLFKTSEGKNISKSGLEKLSQDLGSKMTTATTDSTDAITVVLISK